MTGYGWLPSILAEIAETAGLEAALKLAAERGGTEVYIPAACSDDHWLAACVGREAADRICRHFASGHGGISLRLPLGPQGSIAEMRRIADRMIAEGRPTSEIARAVGYTSRTVERRRARLRSRHDPRQGSLF
ncbi:helix-turn-helix domain-containing protein [Kaustia mangrovi]|uniref:Helix-turn-helix domain-containing protein n=1 Tax=Kaustia mangrovi TaxID=2593653 RepID=A0A7S8HDS1_9HYPH|nr:hypothetical protein [Kaustia mangrovi]QPC44608.1 helix-turn-helix domain-containing protein [Kaustia mangrovi]